MKMPQPKNPNDKISHEDWRVIVDLIERGLIAVYDQELQTLDVVTGYGSFGTMIELKTGRNRQGES